MTILTDIMDETAKITPEYLMLLFEEKEYTNLQLHAEGCRIGNGLMELGLAPGDVIHVHMENSPELAILSVICARAGFIFSPSMFLVSAEELSWMIEHSEAKYIITTPSLVSKVRLACPHMFEKNRVILVGEEPEPGTMLFSEICAGQPTAMDTNQDIGDDDIVAIIYTSGITGVPKGVLLTHLNLGSNVQSLVTTNRITRDEVALTALPLAHTYGLTTALMAWYAGLTSVLMSWFDAERIFEYTERLHIRSMSGVPAMYIHLLNHPHAPQYNVRSWKRLQSGAAPLPEEVLRAFREKFGVYLYEGYGLTEASPVVSCQRLHLPVKAGSVGPPIDGVEISIRDDFERELPHGSPGEIVVRGPNVMKGYLKDPEETERTLRGGWLHTGDIGYLDEDGYLYIVERKKDLIISGGFNLFPSEVEKVLKRHPAVGDAVVVGEPDPIRGEVVHAFVVLAEGKEVPETDLIEFTRKSLVYYKCPHRISFVQQIPYNFLGKPSRRELRERLIAR